jgi:HCOMODA/2-hydroxy-3-carboxy-muconic semialdehyde decarboxylase
MSDDSSASAFAADLLEAARVVAGTGLSDAFGHVSVRTADGELLITPPVALSLVTSESQLAVLPTDATTLPAGTPREAWLHTAIASARPEVGAICRAQPPSVAALVAAGLVSAAHPFPALTGHAAMIGPVAVYEDSRLIRDYVSATAVVGAAGGSDIILLRGNGAVTVGVDLPSAVARMWVLERSADLALRAFAAGAPQPLPDDEASWWRERASELLPRIYAYLTTLTP